MISYLKGEIIELDFNSLTILTSGGVGYAVVINEIISANLVLNDDAEIFIYHHKTENSEALFGFLEKSDKDVFTELIKISGVGGKVAMQILSLGIERLIHAIQSADNKTIEGIKGIGKKMAEKIILELKDKEFKVQVDTSSGTNTAKVFIDRSLFEQIKDTLVNMGYQGKDVERVLEGLPEEMKGAGDILPYCIRELS
ncbi:Holliday junction branch migration protein RuvA [Candidatus Gracilibacteria bacterium 28_42_T64]|nr:Holliday junction branch migration protein RuvA [Candidatus Gracilibacteria bacterium 28_42_T64]